MFCVDAVEVGFNASDYTVSESDSTAMVCVEVKSGELEPAEVVMLTLSTAPGTALGEHTQLPENLCNAHGILNIKPVWTT